MSALTALRIIACRPALDRPFPILSVTLLRSLLLGTPPVRKLVRKMLAEVDGGLDATLGLRSVVAQLARDDSVGEQTQNFLARVLEMK